LKSVATDTLLSPHLWWTFLKLLDNAELDLTYSSPIDRHVKRPPICAVSPNTKNSLEKCFSTCGPRPSSGPRGLLVGRQNYLVLFKTVVSYTLIIKFINCQPYSLYEHKEMTKLVHFISIKGMTETNKLLKGYGGPPKCLY